MPEVPPTMLPLTYIAQILWCYFLSLKIVTLDLGTKIRAYPISSEAKKFLAETLMEGQRTFCMNALRASSEDIIRCIS
jgi:hypothetical protein